MCSLVVVRFLGPILEPFSKQAEDTQPKWNHLVVCGTWSSSCAVIQSGKTLEVYT